MRSSLHTPPATTGKRDLLTPEGVDLSTRLADVGTRIGAFAIDLALLGLVQLGLFLVVLVIGVGGGSESAGQLAISLFLVGVFVLRYFYFTIMESGRRAATWGKRMLGLRVASRTSPRLQASAVFTRNALRELEFFLPIQLLFTPGVGVDGLVNLALLIWVGVFLFFPLLNRDRLRVGDLLAGTWVVRNPRPELMEDLSDVQTVGDFAFTPAQVDAYGVHELHVLEDVLRSTDRTVQADVAERIRRRVGWTKGATERNRDFLDAYYRALRERLESRLMFGERRADKHDMR